MAFDVDAGASFSGPDWLKKQRQQAAQQLSDASLPSAEEEMWRYSRIDEIDLDRYQLASAEPSTPTEALTPQIEFELRLVVVDGVLVRVDGASVNVTAESSIDPIDLESHDYFQTLNAALVRDVIVVDVKANKAIAKPVVIVHISTDDVIAFPRVVLRAGEASQVSVLEYFVNAGSGSSLQVPVTYLALAQASNVSYISAQLLNKNSNCIAYQVSSVERDATLASSAVALGGDYARVRTDSRLIGQGATSRLDAVYFGTGRQMHDFRTVQDHRAPKTTSDLLFKGVVSGKAHSVYSGLIRVEKGAGGTNAFQTNRNLVLSEGARADSVPNLEIEENDVRCSHASAVGPVDEEQRYYLESRGVPTAVAERLIVAGFLEEMVSRIGVADIQEMVRVETRQRLNEFLDAKALAG